MLIPFIVYVYSRTMVCLDARTMTIIVSDECGQLEPKWLRMYVSYKGVAFVVDCIIVIRHGETDAQTYLSPGIKDCSKCDTQ